MDHDLSISLSFMLFGLPFDLGARSVEFMIYAHPSQIGTIEWSYPADGRHPRTNGCLFETVAGVISHWAAQQQRVLNDSAYCMGCAMDLLGILASVTQPGSSGFDADRYKPMYPVQGSD